MVGWYKGSRNQTKKVSLEYGIVTRPLLYIESHYWVRVCDPVEISLAGPAGTNRNDRNASLFTRNTRNTVIAPVAVYILNSVWGGDPVSN